MRRTLPQIPVVIAALAAAGALGLAGCGLGSTQPDESTSRSASTEHSSTAPSATPSTSTSAGTTPPASPPLSPPRGTITAPLFTPPSVEIPTASPGKPPSKPKGVSLTVTGVVGSGVENGCLLLSPGMGGPTYLLIGGDRSQLTPGARVRVTGSVRTDVATTCQQGTTLEVGSVQVLDSSARFPQRNQPTAYVASRLLPRAVALAIGGR